MATAQMNTGAVRDLLAARSKDGAPREHAATGRFCARQLRDAFDDFQPFATADGLQVHRTQSDHGTYTLRYAFIVDADRVLLAAHIEHMNRTDSTTWRYSTQQTPQWLHDALALTEQTELAGIARHHREALSRSGAMPARELLALVVEDLDENLRAALSLIAAGDNTIDHLFSHPFAVRTGDSGPRSAFTALEHQGLIEAVKPLPPGRVLAHDTQVRLTADGRQALQLIGEQASPGG